MAGEAGDQARALQELSERKLQIRFRLCVLDTLNTFYTRAQSGLLYMKKDKTDGNFCNWLLHQGVAELHTEHVGSLTEVGDMSTV